MILHICLYIHTLYYIYIYIYYIKLYYVTFYYFILHYIILYYITLQYITLHYITLYYIILHYFILYFILLYHLILYHRHISIKLTKSGKMIEIYIFDCQDVFFSSSILWMEPYSKHQRLNHGENPCDGFFSSHNESIYSGLVGWNLSQLMIWWYLFQVRVETCWNMLKPRITWSGYPKKIESSVVHPLVKPPSRICGTRHA